MLMTTVVSGDEYLRTLEKKRVIYPQKQSTVDDIWENRRDSFSGSMYCCKSVLWRTEMKPVAKGDLPLIAQRIGQCDDRQARDFIRGLECFFSESEEDSPNEYRRIKRSDLIKSRKARHRQLEKTRDTSKRTNIEEEIRRIDEELEKLDIGDVIDDTICSFSVPPAWYVSYRSGRQDWGIHFVEPLMFMYTESAYTCLKNRTRGSVYQKGTDIIPQRFIDSALYSVLEHETFHFAFNLFMDKSEKILDGLGLTNFNQPILYTTYNVEVYTKTYRPKGATEEALASAWEYESLVQSICAGILKHEIDVDESVRRLKAWKKNSPPGYNRFNSFCSGRDVDELKLKKACILLLRDTLRKCPSANRSVVQSLQDMSSVLYSMLPSRTELQQIDIPFYVHRER